MLLCSLVQKLCTKEENDKTGCNFNFGHECRRSQQIAVLPLERWIHNLPKVLHTFKICNFIAIE